MVALGVSAALLAQGATTQPPRSAVVGTVVDDVSGAPVSAASVRLLAGGQLIGVTDTDLDGSFRLLRVSATGYRLEVERRGYRQLAVSLSAGLLSEDVRLRMPRLPTLAGRVWGAAEGHTVIVQRGAATVTAWRATVRADGNFGPIELPVGEYQVGVLVSGRDGQALGVSETVRVGVGPGAGNHLSLTAPDSFGVGVSGIFVGGRSRGHRMVTLVDSRFPTAALMRMTVSGNEFEIPSVRPGRYTLLVEDVLGPREVESFAMVPVEVGYQDVLGVRIELEAGVNLRMPLRPEGCRSVRSISLTPVDPWPVRASRRGVLDQDGVTFANVAPGRYRMSVDSDEQFGPSCSVVPPDVEISPVRPAEPSQVVALISLGAVVVNVVTRSTNSRGFVGVLAGAAQGSVSPLRVGLTDGSRPLEFGGLEPGRYRVAIYEIEEEVPWFEPATARTLLVDLKAGARETVEFVVARDEP